MGRKKGDDTSINMDSFLDIMTCLVGVLVLIIILTGVDAAQIKVLIPTPIAHETNKRPIFFECRNNELYHIELDKINRLANDRLMEIADESGGDTRKMLSILENTFIETESYNIDLSYALVGQYALKPKEGASGYKLEDALGETEDDWYGSRLGTVDNSTQIISFLVRDDSFLVFKKARALAWLQKIQVSYELLDLDDPIKFGLGGKRSYAQ